MPLKWVLPAIVDPGTSRCYMVPVPDEPQHIAAFLGAIFLLSKPYAWQDDEAHTAIEVGAVWRKIFDNLLAGDCATCLHLLDCSYDFALSEAAPWTSSPTLTYTQTTWALIFGWIGSYNVAILADWSEVQIEANFNEFTLTAFTVAYALPSSGSVGDDWSARFYDQENTLLYELPDSLGNPVAYYGPPIPGVMRIVVHRRQTALFLITVAQIEQIYIKGAAADSSDCASLIPTIWCHMLLGGNGLTALIDPHAGTGYGGTYNATLDQIEATSEHSSTDWIGYVSIDVRGFDCIVTRVVAYYERSDVIGSLPCTVSDPERSEYFYSAGDAVGEFSVDTGPVFWHSPFIRAEVQGSIEGDAVLKRVDLYGYGVNPLPDTAPCP